MRWSTRDDRVDDRDGAIELFRAAHALGVRTFDTADSYGPGAAGIGHNESLLAAALGDRAEGLCVVTKVGLTRPKGGWVPDGRAKHLKAAIAASVARLAPLGTPTVLLHAPDPRTKLDTSLRALRSHDGPVGVSNATLGELRRATELLPVAAVQLPVSVLDASAVLGGVVRFALDAGMRVLAHSPFGGPRRAASLGRHPVLRAVAARHDASPHGVALAWLCELGLHPLPGPTQLPHLDAVAEGQQLRLSDADRHELFAAFEGLRWLGDDSVRPQPPAAPRATVWFTVGRPGSGKSTWARQTLPDAVRLNRDERGGRLRSLLQPLRQAVADGADQVLLDNTYGTRAQRAELLAAAWGAGAEARAVWVDVPPPRCEQQVVQRLLDRYGHLPGPEELAALAKSDPQAFGPSALLRFARRFEAPEADEGMPVQRVVPPQLPWEGRPAVFVDVALRAATGDEWAVGWVPGKPMTVPRGMICHHRAGPPTCWCRPPLPGLVLALCHAHGLSPQTSTLVTRWRGMRRLGEGLGLRVVERL
jgi:aryl-alcohol dehydrogenase-like predicted oxidoreductase/predicted kinase